MVISDDSDEEDKTKIKLTSWEEKKNNIINVIKLSLTSWGRQGAENPMP